jgi:hypothetical protein
MLQMSVAKRKIRLHAGIEGGPDPCPATHGLEEGRMQNDIQGQRPVRRDHQAPCPAPLAQNDNIASVGPNLAPRPQKGGIKCLSRVV